MSTLQERMAELFPEPRERGLQADIGRLCGVKASSVSAWFNQPEKVAELDRNHAEKICLRYAPSVSPAWLAEGVPPKERIDVAPPPEPTGASDSPPAPPPRFEDTRTLNKEDWEMWKALEMMIPQSEKTAYLERYRSLIATATEDVIGRIKRGELS